MGRTAPQSHIIPPYLLPLPTYNALTANPMYELYIHIYIYIYIYLYIYSRSPIAIAIAANKRASGSEMFKLKS